MWKTTARRDGGTAHAAGAVDSARLFELRVRPDFRKTLVFGLIALAALIAGHGVGGVHATAIRIRLIAYGCAVLVAVFGVAASRTAQPVLGNLFAGLVLLFARPYVPGQRVRVMSGALNGPHVGVIVSAGLLYTVLDTADGPLNIPNSSLPAAAVGPSPAKPEPASQAIGEGRHPTRSRRPRTAPPSPPSSQAPYPASTPTTRTAAAATADTPTADPEPLPVRRPTAITVTTSLTVLDKAACAHVLCPGRNVTVSGRIVRRLACLIAGVDGAEQDDDYV